MALIFSRATSRFYRFKFWVSASHIALTSSLMMSGPNSFNLNPLEHHVWEQFWSLTTSCNRSQNQFPSLKCILVKLVCLTGESHWQSYERLSQATAGMYSVYQATANIL